MLRKIKRQLEAAREEWMLPKPAKRERRNDRSGLSAVDPGIDQIIDEGAAWLARAQDFSPTTDGGVARDYSLISGWSTSYPETTGYIVGTMIEYSKLRNLSEYRERAKRMLDWFAAIQFPEGGFQGGRIDSEPRVPVTFNTGQILLGLAAGVAEFNDYREQMCLAAQWLVDTQDTDGCWRRYPTPFAEAGEKAYETHVAWGLVEAARLQPERDFAVAARTNIEWALGKQQANGWVADCCLDDPGRPLSHTLGYFLRGLIEAYRFFEEPELLAAARLTADNLLDCLAEDGFLAGRFLPDWEPAVSWVCLTGSVQIAHCWLLLYQITGDPRYRDAGALANRFVRRTIKVDALPEARGGVKGSFPVDGSYGRYQYLNWATKFCIDSNILEQEVTADKYP